MHDSNQSTLITFLGIALILAIAGATLLLWHREYRRHIEAMTAAGLVEKPVINVNGNPNGSFWSKP